ncbi:protein SQS1-like [Teratosphaeria destructans]|uniref:Protein SQS1 n=1 Tax=Teratosphaeria destructans TaxID=418781 RepID=A0A9W7W0L6_9PEZI|nr:protein SQS1-like [Teratosphaeria destructans]
MGRKGKGPGGKKQKGRAGQRGKAQKNPPGGWQNGPYHDVDDSEEEQPRQQFKGFAQGTSKNSPRHAVGMRLRHQAIAFVSAGGSTPAEPEAPAEVDSAGKEVTAALEAEDEEVDEDDDEDIDDSAITTNIVIESEITEGTANMELESPAAQQQPLFFVDTEGDTALVDRSESTAKITASQAVRTPAPASSDSSDEEEIVFKGRGNATKAVGAVEQFRSPHVTDDLLASLGASPAQVQLPAPAPAPPSGSSEARGWASRPSIYEQPQGPDTWQPAPATPYWRKPTFNKGRPRPDLGPSRDERKLLEQMPPRESKVRFSDAEDTEPLPQEMDAEATIAELQADVKAVLRDKNSKRREEAALGRKANPASSKTTRRSKRDRKKDNRQLRNVICDEDEDDVERAAYKDYMENLEGQLNAAAEPLPVLDNVVGRKAGPSVAATASNDKSDEWEDEDEDDNSDDGPIGQDLLDVYGSDSEPLNISDYDSSDLEHELFYDEQEMWEDEEDLRQRRQDAMTDEQLARLWAKQSELGIDADELMIDDGMFDDGDEEGIGDLVAARIGLRDITNAPTSRSRKKKSERSSRHSGGFDFPDASALADTIEQYGEEGFDIMDLDRPSLRNTKKGRKGKLPADLDENLSDEDLKDQLRSTWDRDRDRKRVKKAEREELRAQGLLGRGKNGKADLGQKYLQGMTMEQVHEELRLFLQDDGKTTQSFPPMDKRDRKALHDIANMMNLKSKSVGSGNSRFPIIYKTTSTIEYREGHFNKVLQHASRGFLKNNKYKGGGGPKGKGKQPKPMRAGRGGGFSKDAVTIRDGEVVGANAAEIGKESFGHKLMEKMGWSKGMALGKDGEGLLVPVEQVMRSGTRGLG